MKLRPKLSRKGLTKLVVALAVAGATVYIVSIFAGLLGVLPPLWFKRPVYLRVVQAIQQGKLTSKSYVISSLPLMYKGVAPRDKVLCERNPNGRLLVLFPTWYGRGSDLQGYLYCSSPLTKKDYYSVDWGAGGVVEHVAVCGIDLLSVEKVDNNWYTVMRRLD